MCRARKTACLFLLTIFLLVTAQASENTIINHILTDRVIIAEDETVYVSQVIVGFTTGRAKFHTVTSVLLEKGLHQGQIVLEDPNGKTIVQKMFNDITVETDNVSLIGNWEVDFKQPGLYQFVIYIDKQPKFRFTFIVK
jgi:hypothetical protein